MGDIIYFLIFLVAIFIWIINQISGKSAGGKTPEPEVDEEDAVRSFLQQAQQRSDASQGAAGAGYQPRLEPQPVNRGSDALGGGVASHVSQYMDAHEFDERAEDITELDDVVERLGDHQLGSLRESTADGGQETGRADDVRASAAAGIAAMLSDPQQLPYAIILQDILRRPV